MKLIAIAVICLAVVGVALALVVVSRHAPARDCTGQVVIVKGPHGEPLECVCIGGTLSTCFNPGP